jgi:CxxC motif-containing protein (DUF1111 family)
LGKNAFDESAPVLPNNTNLLFFVKNSLFKQNWLNSPVSTIERDGLEKSLIKGPKMLAKINIIEN